MKNFNKFLALVLLVFLFGCGGSGGSDVVIAKPIVERTDLLFGYYLTCPKDYPNIGRASCLSETINHVNTIWVSGPFGNEEAITDIQIAKLPTVLDISREMYTCIQSCGPNDNHSKTRYAVNPDAEVLLRALFVRLDSLGVLQYIVALYPMDEPDINVSNQNDMVIVNSIARRVSAEFPVLRNIKLAVIFTPTRGYPNVGLFDWVGFDDYDMKSSIFTNGEYAGLLAVLRPDQKTIIVPGGSKGQDPTPFVNFAQGHLEVALIAAFLYTDTSDGPGIRSLPIRNAYCLAGEQIKTPGKTGACNP